MQQQFKTIKWGGPLKENVLLKTNLLICSIIIMGFLITSLVSYHSNNGIFKRDIEHISSLTSDGIFHQMDSIFSKPINISLAMANDNLLKTFLTEEDSRGAGEDFIWTMRDYLSGYREKYGYDSVFLVSARTNRYYHFDKGVDRILTKDNPENEWYYTFIQESGEYSINIDNDEVHADNKIKIFINCKILSPKGEVLGIVGVAFGVDLVREIFQEYENKFQVRAYLVDKNGVIQISTIDKALSKTDLIFPYANGPDKEKYPVREDGTHSFWYSSNGKNGFLVTRFIPDMQWILMIDHDTSVLEARLNRQLFVGVGVIVIVIGAVLLLVTGIIRRYNTQLVNLVVKKEKAHRTIFQEETEKMYENIYEIDITYNKAASEATEKYFESLGTPKNMPYDQALRVIAREQIKEEYQEGYISTFSPDNVLKMYQEGQKSLCYDFMYTNDGGHTYYWMRIIARIFYWEEDNSVRMLIYRQNIDNEKRNEIIMIERMQKDPLSGLFHKSAAQELARRLLLKSQDHPHAFFILDIDNFKTVNDTCGHAFGDKVIIEFAQRIKSQFSEEDIVGRIGGDEFIVFVAIPSFDWAKRKAKKLSETLRFEVTNQMKSCQISASIGVAISPEAGTTFERLYQNADTALYQTKAGGKNGFRIYHEI